MKFWIADLIESGHSLDYIMNLCYHEYSFIIDCITEKRRIESGNRGSGATGSKELRPVQRDAIKRSKELEKGKGT